MLVGVPVWPAGPKQARHMGPRAASKGSKMYENGSWDRAGHQGILPNLRTVHLLSNSVQPIRANGAAWLPLSSVSFVVVVVFVVIVVAGKSVVVVAFVVGSCLRC